MSAFICDGRLMHARLTPVKHCFDYPVWMVCADIARLDELDRECLGFGHNRMGLCAILDRDHLEPSPARLTDKLARCLRDAGERETFSRAWLITVPRILLLPVFNPLSLFVCTGDGGRIQSIVVEVRNTYHEAHAYVLPAQGHAKRTPRRVQFEFPKAFFVSPFNGLEGMYALSIDEPFDPARLLIHLDLFVRSEAIVRTSLRLRGEPVCTRSIAATLRRHPVDALLTVPRIVHQALMLRWRHRLKSRMKPHPISAMTLRHASSRSPLPAAEGDSDARRSRMRSGDPS